MKFASHPASRTTMKTAYPCSLITTSTVVLAVLATQPAFAQTVPDAGVLERQLREEMRQAPTAAPEAEAPVPEQRTGEAVAVSEFVIEDATLIPADELEALLDDRIGKSLTLGELQAAAQEISDHYRERGYFARAYLPQQDVTEGVIIIQVVEGRLGDVTLRDDAERADAAYVEQVVTGGLQKDAPLSATRLERGLLLANDLPGIRATGVLAAGDEVGESDLTLQVEDMPFVTGDFGFNNFGSRATDEIQATGGFALNNLSGRGDQATFRALASKNLAYVNGGYSAPIGSDGLRAGVSASYLTYELGDRFELLEAEGDAYTLGADMRYPFLRSGEQSLWGALAFDHRKYDDDILGVSLHRKEINVFTASASGDFMDGFGLGGFNYYNVALIAGDVDLSDDPADLAADQAGPGTDGRYAKLSFSFNRDQLLPDDWYARGRISGQLAADNLDSSEKFALGGPYGVRAYPTNEALGDDAAMLNIELHKMLGKWDMFGFADAGVIRQYHDTWSGWNAGSTTPNHYWLAGVGAGAHYALEKDIRLTGMTAVPVGTHKGESADGSNQDGSNQDFRLWVGLTKTF